MTLFNIPLEKLTEDDIRSLVETGAREGLQIEFKRVIYGGSDEQKLEFPADASALANTSGGDILIQS